MAAYPDDRFVQEFSRRTYQNLQDIKAERQVSYTDTALISSLLAVFVLPKERADDPNFMAELLSGYEEYPLSEIVKVLRPSPSKKILIGEEIGPKSIGEIPKFLRHAVAHLNIRPESADEQSLTHLLVWNVNPYSKKTTFVARVHVRRLQSLALHVLERLSRSGVGDKYEGINPIARFDADHPELSPDRD